MPTVKLYVEGGGESNALRTACRQGFRQFLEKAGLAGRMPRIVACGSRNDAYDSFCTALRQNREELPLLLVDSEALVAPGSSVWDHLRQRDNWQRPANARGEQTHLMAQCMETWLDADPETLAHYFGQGFNRNNLPRRDNLETVSKPDVFQALERATRRVNAGTYNKGRHSFELLARINPTPVRERCSYAERFLVFLLNNL